MKGRNKLYLIAETLDIFGRGLGVEDVNDDHLSGSHTRRQHQTLVVTVDHNHHTDRTGGQTPTVLPDKLTLYKSNPRKRHTARFSFIGDVEHLGEVLTQAVGSGSLDSTAVGRDEGFDGGGVETASELFLLRLATLNDRDSQDLFIHTSVVVEDLQDFFFGLFLCSESTVTFLRVR